MLDTLFGTGKLAKMIIKTLPEAERKSEMYQVQVNPETITASRKVLYDHIQAIGNSGNVAKYTGTAPSVLNFEILFDGTKYASGLYLYKLKSGDFIQTHKMLLMK